MPFARDAERVCAYLVARVQRAAGPRWAQGEHAPPLGAPALAGSGVDTVARRRLWRVPRHVAVGLVAWARGARDVELREDVPTPRHVLGLQAVRRRCVSLLPEGAKEDGREFLLHDLCHLEKFVDPEHHDEQVGFFGRLTGAMDAAGWQAFDRRFDEAWRKDVEHVAADMNGSAIFLFAALKMKLKMAVRRELARADGRPSPTGGPLTAAEARAFDAALGEMLDLLTLSGDARDAALAVSTKRDTPADALRLQAWFASLAPPRPRMLGE
jgi:hypothetical protein